MINYLTACRNSLSSWNPHFYPPPPQNMQSFSTVRAKSSQISTRCGRRSRRRQTESPGPTRASLLCPSTCGSIPPMVRQAELFFCPRKRREKTTWRNHAAHGCFAETISRIPRFVSFYQCSTWPWWIYRAWPRSQWGTSLLILRPRSETCWCSLWPGRTAWCWLCPRPTRIWPTLML